MTSDSLQGWGGRRAHQLDSFTLVEMMVAIAILAIIMIVLLNMTGSLSALWQSGQAHNERRTNTQAIFERMARDLQQVALPSTRAGSPLFANTNSLEMVINPSGVSTNYEFPQALFWQAPVATDGSKNGNLAIVGYFVQWVSGAPCLCRALINPSTYSIYANTAQSSWISDSSLSTNAPATAASGYTGLMSVNVLGLWVQVLDGQGNPIQQAGSTVQGEAFDSRLGYAYANNEYTNSSGNPVAMTNAACGLPASVQIAIVIIDSATARHLTGIEKPNPPASYLTGNFWSDIQNFYSGLPPVIRKGAEIQTTTVQVASGPR